MISCHMWYTQHIAVRQAMLWTQFVTATENLSYLHAYDIFHIYQTFPVTVFYYQLLPLISYQLILCLLWMWQEFPEWWLLNICGSIKNLVSDVFLYNLIHLTFNIRHVNSYMVGLVNSNIFWSKWYKLILIGFCILDYSTRLHNKFLTNKQIMIQGR
jgi:hypothetical protein